MDTGKPMADLESIIKFIESERFLLFKHTKTTPDLMLTLGSRAYSIKLEYKSNALNAFMTKLMNNTSDRMDIGIGKFLCRKSK